MNIVGNCGLCDQHSLHIMGEGETETQQCINCGYVTSARYKLNGTKREEHELFKNLTEEMQNWSVVHNDSIWIPTVMTLPLGMLYPINIYNTVSHETELKWAFAKMVDIPQQEQKNYQVALTKKNNIFFLIMNMRKKTQLGSMAVIM